MYDIMMPGAFVMDEFEKDFSFLILGSLDKDNVLCLVKQSNHLIVVNRPKSMLIYYFNVNDVIKA